MSIIYILFYNLLVTFFFLDRLAMSGNYIFVIYTLENVETLVVYKNVQFKSFGSAIHPIKKWQ